MLNTQIVIPLSDLTSTKRWQFMEGYVPDELIRTSNGANSNCVSKRKSS